MRPGSHSRGLQGHNCQDGEQEVRMPTERERLPMVNPFSKRIPDQSTDRQQEGVQVKS